LAVTNLQLGPLLRPQAELAGRRVQVDLPDLRADLAQRAA
jgi:hypothetical protein